MKHFWNTANRWVCSANFSKFKSSEPIDEWSNTQLTQDHTRDSQRHIATRTYRINLVYSQLPLLKIWSIVLTLLHQCRFQSFCELAFLLGRRQRLRIVESARWKRLRLKSPLIDSLFSDFLLHRLHWWESQRCTADGTHARGGHQNYVTKNYKFEKQKDCLYPLISKRSCL